MTKEDLIQGLNSDLAAELGTVIRYTYQASKSVGVMGIEMREMFEEEVQDEQGHASYLMDVIVDLGAEPCTAVRRSSRWTPAHIACTKDGVERWNRENRPNRSPLLWDRAERPVWTAAGADREPGVADTRRGYVRRSTSARVRQSESGPRAGDR